MKTKFFGDISINEENIYYFKNGIPGFEDLKTFILLKEDGVEEFSYMQSTTDEDICFILVTPWQMKESYELEDIDEVENEVGFTKSLEVYLVVSMSSVFESSTVNIQAPILLNPDTRQGIQWILRNQKYSIKTPLIDVLG